MATNILLLEKGCQNCSFVKARCDFDKIEDDTYVGKNGEKIFVFISSSSEASKLISEKFGTTQVMPILIKEDKTSLTKVDDIIQFLRTIGYYK